MRTISPRGDLLAAFATAIEADIALSPMIMVGGTDDTSPWIQGVLDLATASGIYYTAEYRADTQDSVMALADWVRDADPDRDGMRCVAITVQGLGENHLLGAMLQDLRSYETGECLIVVVVDPDQLATARRDIRTILDVHQSLVPVCWQGIYPAVHEVLVCAEGTVRRSDDGSTIQIYAETQHPYPHRFLVEVDTDGIDADEAWAKLDALGPLFPFAALTTFTRGPLVADLEDILPL